MHTLIHESASSEESRLPRRIDFQLQTSLTEKGYLPVMKSVSQQATKIAGPIEVVRGDHALIYELKLS